jgi:hypothetical protein
MEKDIQRPRRKRKTECKRRGRRRSPKRQESEEGGRPRRPRGPQANIPSYLKNTTSCGVP